MFCRQFVLQATSAMKSNVNKFRLLPLEIAIFVPLIVFRGRGKSNNVATQASLATFNCVMTRRDFHSTAIEDSINFCPSFKFKIN